MNDAGGEPVEQITRLLERWSGGDSEALERVTDLLYKQLHGLALSYLRRERNDHTLQPTALIHELYMRLTRMSQSQFESRQHFLGLSARIMRQILTDHARRLSRAKRGGNPVKVTLDDALRASDHYPDDYLILDEALTRLGTKSALHAQVIELRYFTGLTTEEVAEVLAISKTTVNRTQRMAEAWLGAILNGEMPSLP